MKKTQIDRAIDSLEGEKAVLQMAIDTLKAQQGKASTRKPRKLKAVPASVGNAG